MGISNDDGVLQVNAYHITGCIDKVIMIMLSMLCMGTDDVLV